MQATVPENQDILRQGADLRQVHRLRLEAVELRLPAFATAATDLYGKLALSRFALNRPEVYFDRAAALAIQNTLDTYAGEDRHLLLELLDELRPQLDAAFEHLAMVNADYDDGHWPTDEIDQLRLLDTQFLYRHLRLLEYVLDFLTMPIVAFHCEHQGKQWQELQTSNRLEDHLPNTPSGILAEHWSRVVRNGIAHGGVRHLPGKLEFTDNKGRTESRSYYEFVRSTDRLLDACNGAALAYLAFFLKVRAAVSGHGVPLAVARAVLSAYVDRPVCSVAHVAVVARGERPQLHVNLRHRFGSLGRILLEAHRTALVGLDLMPEMELFSITLQSSHSGLSFFIFDGKDLASYATGQIGLGQLLKRVSERQMHYFDPSLPMRPALSLIRSWLDILRSGWPGLLQQLREQARGRGEMPLDIIEVKDISIDRMKRRKAAVSVDALPGQTVDFGLRTLRRIAKAVDGAKVRAPGKRPRGASRWGAATYLQVQVYSHAVRPRTPEGNQFASPYLFTLEYARDGKFLLPGLWEHLVVTKGRYRWWIPKRGPEQSAG